jgi:glycosyltransferase involved in cell wall biosynthesis
MKIGIMVNELSPYFVCGGVSTWLKNMLEMFHTKDGFSVRILYVGPISPSALEKDERDIVCLSEDFDNTAFLDVDVVVVSLWSVLAVHYLTRVKAIVPGIPTIVIIHSLDIVERRLFDPSVPSTPSDKRRDTGQEACIRAGDLVVCISQSELVLYERVGYMQLNHNVLVVPNVYVQQDYRVPPVEAYHCNHLGFIGRHVMRKRPDIISQAVYGQLGHGREISVYHAGVNAGGQDDQMFRDRTKAHDKYIHIIPFTHDQRVLQTEYWDKIGASCVTGVYEPFGYTVCEALDRYKPLICVNVGGVAEITRDARPGSVFSYDPDASYTQDIQNIAGAIECFLETPPATRRAMAIRARLTLQKYAPSRVRPQWIEAFTQCMKLSSAQTTRVR